MNDTVGFESRHERAGSGPGGRGRRWVFGVVGVAVLVGLAAAAWTVFQRDDVLAHSPLIGQQMPTLTLDDLDSAVPVTIGPGRQRVTVINFWAPWCVPCQAEHPLLNSFAATHADVDVVGVTYQSLPAESTGFLDRNGRGIRNLFDPDGVAAINFGVVGVPETFVVDRGGVVRARVIGPVTQRLLSELVERITDGRSLEGVSR